MDFTTFLGYFGTWAIGSFTALDLLAATTNAFNGAILASRADHRRKWTVVGIIMLAVLGGIGGGVTRDVLLNDVPSAFTNPWYLILCTLAAMLALRIMRGRTPASIGRIFDFMAAFSLPWYAIVGTQKALAETPLLGGLAVILIGVVGPTAGRYWIDITSGVTPQHFTRGEWFVGTAALTSLVYVLLFEAMSRSGLLTTMGLGNWPPTLLAWLFGFLFRLAAWRFHWEEPEGWSTQPRVVEGAAESLREDKPAPQA
jgi:uncharacterized membrane protein YeiH